MTAGVRRQLFVPTAVSMALALALGAWSWAIGVETGARAMAITLGMLALWQFVEWRMRDQMIARPTCLRILRWHRVVFASTALFIAVRIGLRTGFAITALDPEWIPAARRTLQVTNGLLLVVWGNYLPKLISPWPPEDEPFDWQGVHRFVGRIVMLGGLGMIVVWLALPIELADAWGDGLLVGAMLLALVRKLYSLATYGGRDRAEPRSV
jgi:hypothetical protein